jgi:tRNA-specific 2-thiouridylase
LFPIGHLTKKEVRKIAEDNDLITAFKKDSQGLCFVGNIEMKNFLRHFIPEKIGDVLNENGKIIGRHNGSVFYTFGERHNFEIFEKTDNDKPYYVVEKNLKENTITVSNEPKDFSLKEIKISDINFIQKTPPLNTKIFARSRYRQKTVACTIKEASNKGFLVQFEDTQKDLASGQSIVFYKDGECLGGGIIF